ncbi:MAG: hypothetical protein ACU843_06790 [Gammaproteobacteria bacterium]
MIPVANHSIDRVSSRAGHDKAAALKNRFKVLLSACLLAVVCSFCSPALAFDSTSTGVDGTFNPPVDTVRQLPPDGIFNFTSIDIPAGVTVQFQKNTANTPVTLLVSGDVNIAGRIVLNGGSSTPGGAAGNGNLGDDGIPGTGGPGGFDGGRGGEADSRGGDGLGPGAGISGSARCNQSGFGGSGAGYSGVGAPSQSGCSIAGGPTYGSAMLLPLIGGSGGGGGYGGGSFSGTGGGGGGGAILIAASGTVTITGSILANGGLSGASSGVNCGGTGGGGSGGAIRIVASTLTGNGIISATGGSGTINSCDPIASGGNGSHGRIRLEAETFQRTAATTPGYSFSQPGEVFVAGLPSLAITSVAGMIAPAQPTGSADIVLPENTPNPVVVIFTTRNVPLGNTVELTVTPATGAAVRVISDAISGSEADGSARVEVDIPDGPSTLSARVSFTVSASLRDDLSRYALGEPVERIRLSINPVGDSTTTLITSSGREFKLPSNLLAKF